MVDTTTPPKLHPQTIAERVLERLQTSYPKLRSAKGELRDGQWYFELTGPAIIRDNEITHRLASQCTFPAGTLESKIFGSFLGWCSLNKIRLGMKVKKPDGEEEEAA